MNHNADIEMDVHVGREASTCAIDYPARLGDRIHVVGVAKKHPNDEHDNDLGEDLAVARALRQVAATLERRVTNRIEQNEEERANWTLIVTGDLYD